jgi:hypothetical protein
MLRAPSPTTTPSRTGTPARRTRPGVRRGGEVCNGTPRRRARPLRVTDRDCNSPGWSVAATCSGMPRSGRPLRTRTLASRLDAGSAGGSARRGAGPGVSRVVPDGSAGSRTPRWSGWRGVLWTGGSGAWRLRAGVLAGGWAAGVERVAGCVVDGWVWCLAVARGSAGGWSGGGVRIAKAAVRTLVRLPVRYVTLTPGDVRRRPVTCRRKTCAGGRSRDAGRRVPEASYAPPEGVLRGRSRVAIAPDLSASTAPHGGSCGRRGGVQGQLVAGLQEFVRRRWPRRGRRHASGIGRFC